MITTETQTDPYTAVQHFYARQMQALDARDLQGYADTFTEDATFAHTPGREPARNRDGIVADLHEFHRKFDTDPLQRRHWFNQIVLDAQPDGSLAATVYALVVDTRPEQRPQITASCVVHDVLVRDGDTFLTRSRTIEYDRG